MRRVIAPLLLAFALTGCTATPDMTFSATSGATPTRSIATSPETPSAELGDGWTERALWDACLDAIVQSYPPKTGDSTEPFDPTGVNWNDDLGGYYVAIDSRTVYNGNDIAGIRACAIRGTTSRPEIELNPAIDGPVVPYPSAVAPTPLEPTE
jgi:hypothetical protein